MGDQPATVSDAVERARVFAIERHAGQKRKYTGKPYAMHLENVAALVAGVLHDENMLAAAWLHDVVEDTPTSIGEILDLFGSDIAELVYALTDASGPKDGNRARRKAIDRWRLSLAPARAQTIKLADLIDNTASIVAGDKNFARVYLAEKELLLPVLFKGSTVLYTRAYETLQEGQWALVQEDLRRKEGRGSR